MRTTTLALLFTVAACSGSVQQPIVYNHSVHVGKGQMDCTQCHEGAREEASAHLPPLATCAQCHSDADGTAEQRKVTALVAAGKEIPWVRLFELPRHVFFSHRRHTEAAKIACEQCHGEMGKQTAPPPAPLLVQTMDTCMDCHRARHVTTDCSACHR